MLVVQTKFVRLGRITQVPQQLRDGGLHRGVERAGDAEIETIEIIEALTQPTGKLRAYRIARFLGDKRDIGRRHAAGAPLEPDLERGILQRGVNHTGLPEQAQVAVGELLQFGFRRFQVVSRAALRNQKAQGLFVQLAQFRQVSRRRRFGGQYAVDLNEIASIPGPQAISQAVDLAKPKLGRQRHGVHVVEHDLAPHQRGVLTLLVGAQRG